MSFSSRRNKVVVLPRHRSPTPISAISTSCQRGAISLTSCPNRSRLLSMARTTSSRRFYCSCSAERKRTSRTAPISEETSTFSWSVIPVRPRVKCSDSCSTLPRSPLPRRVEVVRVSVSLPQSPPTRTPVRLPTLHKALRFPQADKVIRREAIGGRCDGAGRQGCGVHRRI